MNMLAMCKMTILPSHNPDVYYVQGVALPYLGVVRRTAKGYVPTSAITINLSNDYKILGLFDSFEEAVQALQQYATNNGYRNE